MAKVFVDGGKTGRTDLCAAFQDALNYCVMMDVDYFITWSSSRFARNHLDAGKYKAMLAPPGMDAIDPAEASEVLRGLVMDCNDPKKLREFVGSFVKEITVGDVEVVVDYHPECLVQLNNRTRVRSAENWLLNLGSNQGPTD